MVGRRRLRQTEKEPTSRLNAIRDVVEIVAILAAGVWAFYTFVYENQIKPAASQPEAQIESSLTRLGTKNGLIAIQSHLEVKNVGVTDIWLYGLAETVVAATVHVNRRAGAPPPAENAIAYGDETGWSESHADRVFAFAFLTRLGDARSKAGVNLRVGVSTNFDRVFYVPANRYDELRTLVSIRYGSHATPIPFRLKTNDQGIVRVDPSSATSTDEVNGNVATLSLWR